MYFPEGRASDKACENLARIPGTVRNIVIALFDGFALQDATAIGQVFQTANVLSESARHGTPVYNVCMLSETGGMIASSSSVSVWTELVDARPHTDDFHAVFIVDGTGIRNVKRDKRLAPWLQRVASRIRVGAPMREGKLWPDAAPLTLDGIAEPSSDRTRALQAKLSGTARYANTAGPLQAALEIIQVDLGTEMMRQIAGKVTPQVETKFSSILESKATREVSERIQASARWLAANCNRPISIGEAAKVAIMSERHFLRRFKIELGLTPSDYLMYVRLDMCCRLLIETNLPIGKIALRCGMNSGSRLSKLLGEHLSIKPTAYRELYRPSTSKQNGMYRSTSASFES